MADCYAIYRVYGWYSAEKCREGARPAVARAMALDPSLAEVHYSQAIVTYYLDRNWRGAIPHLQRALAINPRLSIAQAYMALVLATDYRFDEAMAERDAALALDPLSPFIHYLCATAAMVAGRIDDVIAGCERVLELQPDSLLGYWPLALSLSQRGRHEEAIAAAERAVVLSRSPFYVGVLGSVYAAAGRVADAEQLRRELDERHARGEYVSPSSPLVIAVALNDLDRVRAEIRRCIEDETPPLTVMATSRAGLDALRGDPEIDRLLDVLYDGARPRG
jgi:tetratricopeptide (TPR) repeat protein